VADLAGLGLDRDPLELALGGGEDYELCFTISAERARAAAAEVRRATGTPVAEIGVVVEADRGVRLVRDGQEQPLEVRGWDHLQA
jgi:Thiamine monophosphate kinase